MNITTGCELDSLLTSTSAAKELPRSLVRRELVLPCAIIGGLIFLLYGSILRSLAREWWTNPDYGHGFFIPLLSGYLLWRQRAVWSRKPVKPANVGLVVMLAAVALLLTGSLGAELFLSRISLLVLITGIVLFDLGWAVLSAVAFPLGYLVFMIPLPVLIYNQITFPLQLLASRIATFYLDLIRLPVLRDGNVLIFSNYSLEVVEACSGIRSLLSLVAICVAYVYLAERRMWIRCVLILMMVPIATLSNAVRIMGAGVMAHQFGQAAADGFLHAFSGWIIFLIALTLMVVFHQIFSYIGRLIDNAHVA